MTRIYRVTHGDSVRLIEAANATQARNFAAQGLIEVKVASQRDLLALLPGVEVEQAGKPQGADDETD